MRESTRRHFREVESLPEPTPDAARPGRLSVIVLASGSEGNCLLVHYQGHTLMVDAGISPPQARERARAVGFSLDKLEAVLLTHWHKDHCAFVTDFCREFGAPLVCSSATHKGLAVQPGRHRMAKPGEALDVGEEFTVHSIRVPHEEGSLAFQIRAGEKTLLVAHDLGSAPSAVLAAARASNVLCIEANYDQGMLVACQMPDHPHERIASEDRGHLANTATAEVVSHVDPARIQAICALHVSKSHNTPVEAERAIRSGIPEGARPQVFVASQDDPVLIEVNGYEPRPELALTDRARTLDRAVDALVYEQKVANEESQKRWIRFGAYLLEMQRLFEDKEPGEKLLGYDFYTEWHDAKARDLGVSPRMAWYCLRAEKVLVPLIGREQAESLTMGSSDILAKYVEEKHDMPAELLQLGKDKPAREVKIEVFKLLYPGKTGHFDGPEEQWNIAVKRDHLTDLKRKLEVAKGFVEPITGHDGKVYEASDAEVIEFALEEFIQQHQSEVKVHILQPINGNQLQTVHVPEAPIIDLD